MNKISVNNVTIAYERFGVGKPLMLLHGFPLDHSAWHETALLLKNDFDLILPDLRGFGGSSTMDSQYAMADMADDLAGLLNQLGIENAAIAGHSMGGYAALAFAEKYPQRVSSLGLISSQTLADTPERKMGRYKTADQVFEKGVEVVADAMTVKFSKNEKTQDAIRNLILRQGKSAVIGALKAMAEREDLTALLPKFPTTLIHGGADDLIPVERSREIKNLFPQAQLIEIPNVGHAPMMDAAEKVANALKFLK